MKSQLTLVSCVFTNFSELVQFENTTNLTCRFFTRKFNVKRLANGSEFLTGFISLSIDESDRKHHRKYNIESRKVAW